jgi:hypothetical protein
MSDTNFLEVLLEELKEWSREAMVKGDVDLAKGFREDAQALADYLNQNKEI